MSEESFAVTANMSEKLDEILEIVIPTFNRAKRLKQTLESISYSSVKKCKITVLDNNSSDETEILIKKHIHDKTLPNFTYIKNKYNLGLAGNLCKALSLPEKKFFWIIFDDVQFDFRHFDKIQEALSKNYDVVLTTNYYNVKDTNNIKDKAAVFLMLIYCFAGIFKTSLVDDNVMLHALTDIYTIHPQMALLTSMFNKKDMKLFVPVVSEAVTMPGVHDEKEYTFNRDVKSFQHFRMEDTFLPGFLNALHFLEDVNLKKCVIELLFINFNGIGPCLLIQNYNFFRMKYIINFFDVFYHLPVKYKLQLMLSHMRCIKKVHKL